MASSIMSDLSTDDIQELAELEKLLPAKRTCPSQNAEACNHRLKRKLKVENEAHMAVRRELCNYFADSDTDNSSISAQGKSDRRAFGRDW